MAEDNCIFCKIARGVIPSTTVYEDEDFRVILDLGPASKGHSLILPKKHFANVCELDAETAAKVLPLVYRKHKQDVLRYPDRSDTFLQNSLLLLHPYV